MIEMHLKEPLFTDIFCEPFTKNIERIKNLKKGHSRYVYWIKLDKTCLHHDMACIEFYDLPEKASITWQS